MRRKACSRFLNENCRLSSSRNRIPEVVLFVFAMLLISSTSWAKLGESPRDCIKRYGPPTGTTHAPGWLPNGLIFKRGEYSITCGFERDVCTIVVVIRLSPESAVFRSIPRDDRLAFMEENFETTDLARTRLEDERRVWTVHNFNRRKTFEATYLPALCMMTMKEG